MWLGYPGTSGASFMDYIITDAVTSPMHLAEQYSEKLAYMPRTFFLGDHTHMFPHLHEHVIIDCGKSAIVDRDNVMVANATNLKPLIETAEAVKVCGVYLFVVFIYIVIHFTSKVNKKKQFT